MFEVISSLPVKQFIPVGSYFFKQRPAKDIDIICSKSDIEVPSTGDDYIQTFMHKGKRVECLLIDNMPTLKLIYERYHNAPHHTYVLDWKTIYYILKKAHVIYPSKSFHKTINDISMLQNSIVFEGVLYVNKLIEDLRKDTAVHYKAYKSPKLKGVTKEDFFNDSVEKYIDHDIIHEVVAFGGQPLYMKMQTSSSTVYCHQHLFDSFSTLDKARTVLEEAMVITIERYYIPAFVRNEVMASNPHGYFLKAMEKICTTLTSGWFREYAIDNYMNIVNLFDSELFLEHWERVKALVIKALNQ